MKKCIWILLIVGFAALMVSSTMAADKGAIDSDLIAKFNKQLADQPDLGRIVNAATNNDIKALSLNRELIKGFDSRFNFTIDGSKIINQKSSGRCWMFAGANVVTPRVMSKLDLGDFKLSEAYLAFWDKLEKSNLFLETMIAMRDRSLDDRVMQMYLDGPIGDGGWWTYFTALIEKYGIVPASAMPETRQSSSTGRLNSLLNTLLRKATAELRRQHESGKNEKHLRRYKEEVLADVYRLLVCTYGTPPDEFVFRYEEKDDDEAHDEAEVDHDGKADDEAKAEVDHDGEADNDDDDDETDEKKSKQLIDRVFTPQSFYAEFYGDQMPDWVTIVDNPAMDYNTLYLFESGRNVFEESDMSVLNLPIEKLKEYTYKSLVDSQLVWFACDVGKDNYNDSGMFAVDVYDYSGTFGVDFKTTKVNRIKFNDMSPNHAMVIMAVDTTTDGTPRKWKVENSWGSDKGNSGYWTMYDSWFDEYVLVIIVDRKLLSAEDAALLEQKPVIIEDWQPFFLALKNLQ